MHKGDYPGTDIEKIIYLSDKYRDSDQVEASKNMLDKSPNITYRQLKTELLNINIEFAPPEM